MKRFVVLTVVLALAALTARLRAEPPPVEPDDLSLAEPALLAKAERLRAAGALLDKDRVAAALGARRSKPLNLKLPDASKKPMEPREIAARARRALVRIGWYYRCPDCKEWHVNLAGGYALTADGIAATCFHCVDPAEDKGMRAGFLVAMDSEGTLLPITEILSRDKEMDAAVVRVAGGRFTPLALNAQAMPGDAVYLYSDPEGVAGYFSAGIVNRFYWNESASGPGVETLAGARKLRMNVSTDWAPGSSGAPVLDRCGNVVAHVSTVGYITEDENEDGAAPAPGTPKPKGRHKPAPKWCTTMVLRDAIPALAVKLLLEAAAEPETGAAVAGKSDARGPSTPVRAANPSQEKP